jgi:hypothetical protein
MYRSVLALIQRRHRDGLAAPLLQEARRALYRAVMSQPRHEEAPLSAPGPYSGRLTQLPHLSILGGCCGIDARHNVASMNTEVPDVAVRGADGGTPT